MFGRRATVSVLGVALLVLAVEGVLLVRYYDRYYGSDATSGTPSSSAPAFEATMPEGTMPEGTMPEGTGLEVTDDAESTDPDERADNKEASFVHRATDGNSRGTYTTLSDPRLNGDPDAVVLAEPSGPYERNTGVWYVPGKERWAIFNQDRTAVPAGAAFEVAVPPADEGFVHRAEPANTEGAATYIDDPLVNGKPDAEVSVTQNWNPGGGGGVYNDHPVGVGYDGNGGRWFVYNGDVARMPGGAAFNVAVSGAEPAG